MPSPTKSPVYEGARVKVNFSDSIDLIEEQVHWTPKGVSLLTKWRFEEGAEIEFAFEHEGEKHCCSGVVVACHPLRRPIGYFETVIFFVETPCPKLQEAACACRLARDAEIPHSEARLLTAFHAMERSSSRSRSGRYTVPPKAASGAYPASGFR